jgi:demethylmenaquinone methyltransferase/2-methoxy-6-polyprenyl-1,4-benzoquinol methylase
MNKQEKIISMFNEISPTYDLLNRLLSFGIDRRWRQIACKKCFDLYGKDVERIVDVACGTGDMIHFWKEASKKTGRDVKEFVGVDPSVGMLAVAKEKIDYARFIEGTATQISLDDGSADFASISYGIRNVVERQEAWHEFYRVLKPGGILAVLEFTKPEKENIFGMFTKWYMQKMIPFIGKIISRHSDAYTYLPDSIKAFETTKALKEEMEAAGFEETFIKGYSFEISTLFIMRKPERQA